MRLFRLTVFSTFLTLLLVSCAIISPSIKIYNLSNSGKIVLKNLVLVGVGDCFDSTIKIKFIDGKKILDKNYSAVALKPGLHKFSVELDDEKLNDLEIKQRFNILWKKVERNITLKAGKFYVACPVQKGNLDWTFWFEERDYEFEYYYKYRDDIDYV